MSRPAVTSSRRRRFAALVIVLGALGATASVARAQNPPETIEYYATDALGSVRVVFTPTGQVIGRSDYLPFGDTQEQSGMLPRQRFTGQERDGVAGLDDFNARSLQMRTGRMNRPDPLFGNALTNPQRWNAYSYVTNNPLGFVDPSGNVEAAPLVFRSGVTVCVSCPPPGWEGVHPDIQSSVFDTLFYLNFAFESGDGGFGVGADEGVGGGGQPPPAKPAPPPEQAKQPPQPKPDPPGITGASPPTAPACPGLGPRVWNNIVTTNQVIPGALAPPFLAAGLGIPRQVATSLGTTTLSQAWSASVRGTSVVAGGVAWTATEAWILTVPTALVTFGAVGAAYEGGVAIGSLVDALFFDPCARR